MMYPSGRDVRYASSLAYPRARQLPPTRSPYISSILITAVLCVASFFAGSLWTLQATLASQQSHADSSSGGGGTSSSASSAAAAAASDCNTKDRSSVEHSMTSALARVAQELSSASAIAQRFPDTMSRYASGLARTKKQDFTSLLDMGVPLDAVTNGNEDVLILYNRESAFPDAKDVQTRVRENAEIPLLNTSRALEHCDHVHVILTDHTGKRKQCLAIVPQYESYHIQNWMRVPPEKGGVDPNEPLRMVSRGYQPNGRQQFLPPQSKHTEKFWNMLKIYLREMPHVLAELQPLAEKVAKDDTIVVMVCNFGQSELLVNFACSARARQLDISQVLVFATDEETKELAEGLGLTAFYDKRNSGNMPTDAAGRYGDRKFTAMMLAKVYCVQLISMLGYNILFQDVDIVWFRNPLEYFQNASNALGDFDVYFQDDGAHSQRYAPYSANSGFYYVSYNDRTQYFFTSLLHAGDLILKTDSHQQALIALLNEHASLYGLRVKVLSRDTDEFPGGYHYHQKSGKYMRAFYKGDVDPYIFHMSWTENKNNKLLFLKQSGMWYVNEQCIARHAPDILSTNATSTDLVTACCSAEPLVSCHYRDKPSKIPCKDSPPIDHGKPSFW